LKYRFEEEILIPIIAKELRKKYQKYKDTEFKDTEFYIPLEQNEYSPPRRSIRIDFLGISDSESIIVETKQLCDPSNVAFAFGEVLMYRHIVRDKEKRICKNYNIKIKEPIRLGLCFPDFPQLYKFDKKDYGYRSWTKATCSLVSKLVGEINEKVYVYLIKSRKNKKGRRDLTENDLYVCEISDKINKKFM